MDVSRIHSLGWHHTTSLEDGIRRTWEATRKELVG
jgi:GDP-L-fucose synthase